jgi:hypothetical protein
MHDYVIYCYRLPAGSGSMFAMGISVPQFIGAISLLNYDDEATLRQSLGVMGLTAAQQNQLITGVAASGAMFVMSGVSITNGVAANFGIHLHDGEMPQESNEIQFTKCGTGAGLMVNILLNDQIMPAPVRGCFPWQKVRQCLIDSGVFTAAQVDAIKQNIETSGSDTQDWKGVSTAIISCLG